MSNGQFKAFGDITGAATSYQFNETNILIGFSGVTSTNLTPNNILSLSVITFNTGTCSPDSPVPADTRVLIAVIIAVLVTMAIVIGYFSIGMSTVLYLFSLKKDNPYVT